MPPAVSNRSRPPDGRLGALCLYLLVLVLLAAPAVRAEDGIPEWLPGLLAKEHITIVVTDSGLGGLSVVADAAERFRRNPVFREVDLVFVNALYTNEGGYNSLRTREEKLQVLDSALRGMHERFAPDLILVACNTLSVLVPDTAFSRAGEVPIVGIVDHGVEQIAEQLRGQPAARNIIMATQTTVEEGEHQRLLLESGIDAGQIVPQACPQLTLHIEQGFDSEFTEMLIDAYVDDALSRMGAIDGPLYVSFNCTHFGYSLESWQRAFASRGVEVRQFLDPNTRMVDFLLPPALRQRYPAADISVRAVSMIDIPRDRLDSIGRWLHTVSPDTEAALRNFERQPELFEWRAHVAGEAR